MHNSTQPTTRSSFSAIKVKKERKKKMIKKEGEFKKIKLINFQEQNKMCNLIPHKKNFVLLYHFL